MGYFGKKPEVWWKNEGHSPVSAADFAANAVLEKLLRTARPEYGWLSEETEDGHDRLARPTAFVVDPIDGTRAFIAGLDTWCVSVAVVHAGQPVAGVLVAPALSEEFLALEGGIAERNGQAIFVATPSEVLNIAAPEDVVAELKKNGQPVKRIKHVPSLAYRLAMVADGRIDGTLVRAGSHDWDLAAADLILRCAGGRLVNMDGSAIVYNKPVVNHPSLCAASEATLASLLNAL
ncbi:Histidinol-phosphatase [compost metagenome]